jgi:hypothetical protein
VATFFRVSDVCKMLIFCAPGHHLRLSTHSILGSYGSKTFDLPKGRGKPKSTKCRDLRHIEVKSIQLRKLAQDLGLAEKCVDRFFPGLLPRPSAAH